MCEIYVLVEGSLYVLSDIYYLSDSIEHKVELLSMLHNKSTHNTHRLYNPSQIVRTFVFKSISMLFYIIFSCNLLMNSRVQKINAVCY